jgi:hypothetical protein
VVTTSIHDSPTCGTSPGLRKVPDRTSAIDAPHSLLLNTVDRKGLTMTRPSPLTTCLVLAVPDKIGGFKHRIHRGEE